MVEVYECTNSISPAILPEFFATNKIKNDLRVKHPHQVPKAKTFFYGQSFLSLRGGKIWITLSERNVHEIVKNLEIR